MTEYIIALLCAPFMLWHTPSLQPKTYYEAWKKPTVKGVTEAILECERGANYTKIGLEPVPQRYWDLDKINGKKKRVITYETIDDKLAEMQSELANIREELRFLRSK